MSVDNRFPPVLRDVVDWELIDNHYEPIPLLYDQERFMRLPDGKVRIYTVEQR